MIASKYKYMLSVGLVAVLAVAAGAWAQSRKQSVGLCEPSETTFFSCRTAKGKWIGLCGTGANGALIQYRYGTTKNVELRYPRDANEALPRYAHYSRAQTERVEVSFEAAGARYSVFDYFEEANRDAGVRVTRADGREVTIGCVGKVRSRLSELQSRLECDADSALNLGGCGAPSGQ